MGHTGFFNTLEAIGLVNFSTRLKRSSFYRAVCFARAKAERRLLAGQESEFAAFYEEHESEFLKVYNMLEDDFSRETYRAIIQFRKTYDIQYLKNIVVKPQYFLKDILPPSENEIYIDGGAYIGQGSLEFLRSYQTGEKYKVYLWEPDRENAKRIPQTLRNCSNYEIKPFALWSSPEGLSFSSSGGRGSAIVDGEYNGTSVINADSIDHQHKGERITFITMDIEGSEIEALKGAEKTIREQRPKLAICIYHKPSHLYEIPMLIKSMVPEYKIYIRHHEYAFNETVAYAVV